MTIHAGANSSLKRPFKPLLVLIETKSTAINTSVLGTKSLLAQLHWRNQHSCFWEGSETHRPPGSPLTNPLPPGHPCDALRPPTPACSVPLPRSPSALAAATFPQCHSSSKRNPQTDGGQTIATYCALISCTVQLSWEISEVCTTSICPGLLSSR